MKKLKRIGAQRDNKLLWQLTSVMEEMMLKCEAFAKHAPFMEKIDIDQNRVILKDNKQNRIVEVLLKDGELQCLLDET